MITGSMPANGGNLILSMEETVELRKAAPIAVSWCVDTLDQVNLFAVDNDTASGLRIQICVKLNLCHKLSIDLKP